jgi:hypothetical protein
VLPRRAGLALAMIGGSEPDRMAACHCCCHFRRHFRRRKLLLVLTANGPGDRGYLATPGQRAAMWGASAELLDA